MPKPIEVQICHRAFANKVPTDMWRAYGHAGTPKGAMRHYRRAYRETHPQQNAWSGHVRMLVHGIQVPVYAPFGLGYEQEILIAKLLTMTQSQVQDYANRVFGTA